MPAETTPAFKAELFCTWPMAMLPTLECMIWLAIFEGMLPVLLIMYYWMF